MSASSRPSSCSLGSLQRVRRFRHFGHGFSTFGLLCAYPAWAQPTPPDHEPADSVAAAPAEPGPSAVIEIPLEPEASATNAGANEVPVTAETPPPPRADPTGVEPTPSSARAIAVDTVWVLGRPDLLPRVAGSAHVVGRETLERSEYDDVERVLARVPGVYVRGEDGFGLRPNIGLRGASSDRSAKITLMEDGVLLAPAPYSAPAAYYFPLTTRIVGMEVFKGPSAVRHGPQTIGGAINLQTRAIPTKHSAELDVAQGRNDYAKMHGFWGTSGARWGVLVEGAHIGASGFKAIDHRPDADTGFRKREGMLKARVHSDPGQSHYHQLEVKGGFADEVSNETYLGLSDADFRDDPYRRYLASELDRMQWWRSQAQGQYYYSYKELADVQVTAYRHDFSRAWRKLNRFRRGSSLEQVLADVSVPANAALHAVLTGEEDSVSPDQALMIGINDRRYVSQGVAAIAHFRPTLGSVHQEIELGMRLHSDSIERHHTEDGYMMQAQSLVPDGTETLTNTRNRGEAVAAAFHLHDQVTWKRLSLSPGLRVEVIGSSLRDRQADTLTKATHVAAIPGGGAHVQALSWLGVFGGVYYGFSPVSPGQPSDVRPERSLNYETGFRIAAGNTQLEGTGFFNDYRNLTGECTLSSGCDDTNLNRQFNAGRVHVYGIETALSQRITLPRAHWLSGQASYTWTGSRFRSDFASGFPLFADVTKGDELPYVPKHQASATLVAGATRWESSVSVVAVGQMRDVAGAGEIPTNQRIKGYAVVDWTFELKLFHDRLRTYATLQNLLNQEYMISRRPYGARPGRPFSWVVGIKAKIF